MNIENLKSLNFYFIREVENTKLYRIIYARNTTTAHNPKVDIVGNNVCWWQDSDCDHRTSIGFNRILLKNIVE